MGSRTMFRPTPVAQAVAGIYGAIFRGYSPHVSWPVYLRSGGPAMTASRYWRGRKG